MFELNDESGSEGEEDVLHWDVWTNGNMTSQYMARRESSMISSGEKRLDFSNSAIVLDKKHNVSL